MVLDVRARWVTLLGVLSCLACSSSGAPAGGSGGAAGVGQAGTAGTAGGADVGGAAGSGGLGTGGVIYGAGGFDPLGGGGSAPATCGDFFVRPDGTQTACDQCGAAQCCDQAMACEADTACAACVALPSGHGCDTVKNPPPAWLSLASCLSSAGVTPSSGGPCADVCASTRMCNAVTNDGCADLTGCDVDSGGIGRCFAAGGVPLCGACDTTTGVYCAPTLHCLASKSCARFCCGDEDCGTGRCVSWPLGGGTLGVCIAGSSGEVAACDAPATATTDGSCAK